MNYLPKTHLEAAIEQAAADTWAYVRENRDSLDSERGCAMIRKGIDLVADKARALLDKSHAEIVSLRKQLKESGKCKT